ncbi:MAG: amidohydrolase family protein [Anaerolineae bacterium]
MVHVRPDTPVLIDHLDGPHMGNAVEYANVLALAQFDNVFMKLSGLNHFSKDAPLYLEAKPFTQLVIDAFGPEHLVWGSGTPAIVDAHLDREPAEARAMVKGGNLARLLASRSGGEARCTVGRLIVFQHQADRRMSVGLMVH